MAISIKTVKRIAVTLGNLLRRCEAINGDAQISTPTMTQGENSKIQKFYLMNSFYRKINEIIVD
jgi:hypothetical protein